MTGGLGITATLLRLAYDRPAPWWARGLFWLLQRVVADRREPSFVIGGTDAYLRRWHITRKNRVATAYLHHFLRSDDDRALHDHPAWNVSVVLRGAYVEFLTDGSAKVRKAGSIVVRRAAAAHRIELIGGQPVWTLFLMGPRTREWGFHCPQGWRHWKEFTSAADGGATVGKGCE